MWGGRLCKLSRDLDQSVTQEGERLLPGADNPTKIKKGERFKMRPCDVPGLVELFLVGQWHPISGFRVNELLGQGDLSIESISGHKKKPAKKR